MNNGKIFACATMYDFIMGGGESYMIRMLEWCADEGYRPFLLLHKTKKISKLWQERIRQNNITVIRFEFTVKGVNLLCDYSLKQDFYSNCETIVAQRMHCYVHFRAERRIKSNIVFYVVIPPATTPIPISIINKIYSKFLKSEINKGIAFMDEECERYALNSHGKFDNKEYYRIGDSIPDYDLDRVRERAVSLNNKIVIVTVLRYAFPQKAYILGLIDGLKDICSRGKEFELIIVGDGEGKDEVEKHIKNLPSNYGNKIKQLGYVGYDELKNVYSQATVFVGMGTTLIEASKIGIPSIIATAYNSEAISTGYMADDPFNLGGNVDLSKNTYKIVDLINEIITLDEDKYILLSRKCYDSIAENYALSTTMHKILNVENDKKFNHWMLCFADYFLSALKIIKDILRRDNSKFE